MLPIDRPLAVALLGAASLFCLNACSAPTAEDVRIARQAMPISEVSLMLRGGNSQINIINEVNRRHIPETISAALEADLRQQRAGEDLIAALKDEKNLLTRSQRVAFTEWTNTRAEHVSGPRSQPNADQSETDGERRQRLENLNQQNLNNIERNQAEQVNRDYRQETSRSRLEGGRERYSTPYPILYATPSRRRPPSG